MYVVLLWQLKKRSLYSGIVIGVTLSMVFRLHLIRLDIYLPSSSITNFFILLGLNIIFPLGSFHGTHMRHRASSVGG